VIASAQVKTVTQIEEIYMFQKILAAIDSSTIGQKVFDEAVAIAKWSDASLMLLHVLSNEEEGSPAPPIYAGSYALALNSYPT
jgi:nucleotide-binding universal stress UspA family protein